MAAIVRSGAWRLAGSGLLQRAAPPAAGALVQRAPVAIALSQRTQASGLRPERFMTSTTQYTRPKAPATLSLAMEQIEVRKEELYDLLAEAGLKDHDNRHLLKALSAQIKPRPNDTKWRWTKAMELTEEFVKGTIPITGSVLLLLAMFDLHATRTLVDEKKRQQQADVAAKKSSMPYVRGATSI